MNGNDENQTVANTSGRFFCWRDGNKVDQSKYHWSTETTIVIGWLHWSEIWVFRRQLFSRCILTYFAFVYFAYWCNISNWLNNSNQKKSQKKKLKSLFATLLIKFSKKFSLISRKVIFKTTRVSVYTMRCHY